METQVVEELKYDELQILSVNYAPDLRMEKHFDRRFRVSIVISGCLQEESGSVKEEASALSIVTKPSDVKHSNQFGPKGASLLSVEVPTYKLDAPDRPENRLKKWNWTHCGDMMAEVVKFVNVFFAINCNSEAAELIHEKWELLLDRLASVPTPPDKKPPAWLCSVRSRLHETFDKRTSVETLAEDVGVHPTHLTRWFQHFYGCAVTTYRHRLRVKNAANNLVTTNLPLAQVALESGFCDQSHFNHVFKNQTDQTPGVFRNTISKN